MRLKPLPSLLRLPLSSCISVEAVPVTPSFITDIAAREEARCCASVSITLKGIATMLRMGLPIIGMRTFRSFSSTAISVSVSLSMRLVIHLRVLPPGCDLEAPSCFSAKRISA
ncbi:Uncharacterised protein [uncultured archaeon]|nr:Uncharacterised protein [uncultured archaeon]